MLVRFTNVADKQYNYSCKRKHLVEGYHQLPLQQLLSSTRAHSSVFLNHHYSFTLPHMPNVFPASPSSVRAKPHIFYRNHLETLPTVDRTESCCRAFQVPVASKPFILISCSCRDNSFRLLWEDGSGNHSLFHRHVSVLAQKTIIPSCARPGIMLPPGQSV